MKWAFTMPCKHIVILGCILSSFLFVDGFSLEQNTRELELGIEAEEMDVTNGSVHYRSRASFLETVHLYKGSNLTFDICLMSKTALYVRNVVYSNDGLGDKIAIYVDNLKMGDFDIIPFKARGMGWNTFGSSGSFPTMAVLSEGRYKVILTVVSADKHGVEIDLLTLGIVNTSQSVPSLKCMAFCFDDITFSDDLPFPSDNHEVGIARQKSTITTCAEEDNINIPVYHQQVSSFVIVAAMPKYITFSNNRKPDWHKCETSLAFWRFGSLQLKHSLQRSNKNAFLSVRRGQINQWISHNKVTIRVIFTLEGMNVGSIDAYVGTDVFLKEIRTEHLVGNIKLAFLYLDKDGSWSDPQYRTISSRDTSVTFSTPDFTFSDSRPNEVLIEVESSAQNLDTLTIGEFYMFRRNLKRDVSKTLYKDSTTVIEGVDVDLWWRINETMTVTLANSDKVFHDIDYIRIYERIPWADHSYSQVFVLYQDGNVRLLPLTPHGLDWIPFGSSVLIGQNDVDSKRPNAPIKNIQIEPRDLVMKLTYIDGSWLFMKIKPASKETVLEISDAQFIRNTMDFPFFTFRSMWIVDGNADVDHVTAGGQNERTEAILGKWSELRGNYFAFHRKCISKHNTLSPDIIFKITG